ncbi:MAG: ferredoxin family protein [Rikenellaceae bacterium]
MANNKRTIAIDTQRCSGCEVCIAACPAKVLTLSADLNTRGYPYAMMDSDGERRCTCCDRCSVVCPDGCITIYKSLN